MKLNFSQLSLNLTHCAAPQTNVEPRYPALDYTRQPFCLSSAARYITVLLGNWQRGSTKKSSPSAAWEANDTHPLSEKWSRDANNKPRISPVHDFSFHFFKIHFNVILPSKPRTSKWPLSLRYPHEKPVSGLLSPIRSTRSVQLWNVSLKNRISVDYIHANQDRIKWRLLVNSVINTRVL